MKGDKDNIRVRSRDQYSRDLEKKFPDMHILALRVIVATCKDRVLFVATSHTSSTAIHFVLPLRSVTPFWSPS